MRFSQVRTGDDLRQGGRHVRLLLLACERPLSYTPSLIPSLRTNTYTHMLLCALLCSALPCPALPCQARPGQARPGPRSIAVKCSGLTCLPIVLAAGCWLLAGYLQVSLLPDTGTRERMNQYRSVRKRVFLRHLYI